MKTIFEINVSSGFKISIVSECENLSVTFVTGKFQTSLEHLQQFDKQNWFDNIMQENNTFT